MKRNVFWLGMLAMVLTFGMTAVGCDDGSGDPTPQTVTYSGTAENVSGGNLTLKPSNAGQPLSQVFQAATFPALREA